jgi:hypothetical protein
MAEGKSVAANQRPDPAGPAARVECMLTLDGLVASVTAGRAPATVAGEVEAAHLPLI